MSCEPPRWNLSQDTMLMSQKSQLWQCHSIQVADRRSGPRSSKMVRNGPRMVARTWESTPRHATAISKPLGPVPRPKPQQKGQKIGCLGSRAGVISSMRQMIRLWKSASSASIVTSFIDVKGLLRDAARRKSPQADDPSARPQTGGGPIEQSRS